MIGVLRRTRFRLDHRWTPGHMSAYLDGELASRARARLQHHIDECPECRRVLASLARMLGLLQSVPVAATGETPDITSAVRRRLREDRGEASERP